MRGSLPQRTVLAKHVLKRKVDSAWLRLLELIVSKIRLRPCKQSDYTRVLLSMVVSGVPLDHDRQSVCLLRVSNKSADTADAVVVEPTNKIVVCRGVTKRRSGVAQNRDPQRKTSLRITGFRSARYQCCGLQIQLLYHAMR